MRISGRSMFQEEGRVHVKGLRKVISYFIFIIKLLWESNEKIYATCILLSIMLAFTAVVVSVFPYSLFLQDELFSFLLKERNS